MDVQAVVKRVLCHVQLTNAELAMINDPKLEPNHRSGRLARVIKDKGKAEDVYAMLCSLYYVQKNPGH